MVFKKAVLVLKSSLGIGLTGLGLEKIGGLCFVTQWSCYITRKGQNRKIF